MNRIPMHPTRSVGTAFLVVAPSTLLLLVSCGPFTGSLDQEEDSPKREMHQASATDTVRLPSSVLEEHNVELVEASIESLQNRIRMPGVVRPNDRSVVRVRALGRGLVREVMVKVGDRVREGDSMIVVDNFELAELLFRHKSLQADEKDALSEKHLAETILSRSEQLLELEAIPASEEDAARNQFAKAQARLQKIDSKLADTLIKLRRLGVQTDQAATTNPAKTGVPLDTIRSPTDGVITRVGVAPDESITASDILVEVVDLREVWVLADVYEKDIGKVALRGLAEITVSTYPEQPFVGTVTAISDVLDQKTRTAQVRVEVDNLQLKLKLNMFAMVWVPTRVVLQALVLPDSAIQQIQGQEIAFVRLSEGVFERRALRTGRTIGHLVEILEGIRPGEEVVAHGSFLLKSTLLRDQIGGHGH